MSEAICEVDKFGSKFWYLNGKRHREDGPACEYNNGDKEWFLNGKLHRGDGPAIEYSDGEKFWFLNGVEVTRYDIFPITVLGFYRIKCKKPKELTFDIIG